MLLNSSQNEKCFRQTLKRKSKHIFCLIALFCNRLVYETVWKMWKSQTGRRRRYGAFALHAVYHKAADTHSEYVILTAFPLQQWLYECASLLRNTYAAFLVCSSERTECIPHTVISYAYPNGDMLGF
jgi:hypothetical protein